MTTSSMTVSNNNPMRMRALSELYPPAASPDVWNLLHQLATADIDEKGNFVLRRQIRPEEKQILRERQAKLGPWLTSAKSASAADAVNSLFLAFGRTATVEGAKALTSGYVTALLPMPLWAIERACTRFAQRLVKPEEVGAKGLDAAHVPTAPMIAQVAREMVRPYGEESRRIMMTLRGTVPPPDMTPEERAASAERIRTMMRAALARDADADAERIVASGARLNVARRDRTRDEIVAGYRAAGLEPPVPRNGHITSLPMMLRLGWFIRQDGDGRKVLVGPGKPA